jgi:hypothetical protein
MLAPGQSGPLSVPARHDAPTPSGSGRKTEAWSVVHGAAAASRMARGSTNLEYGSKPAVAVSSGVELPRIA